MSSHQQITVKLVLLGDTQVGKSSTVIRFVKNEFDQYRYPTIGATFLTQSVNLENYTVRFEIWDTAGQEKYRSLAPLYYRGAHAALIVYDLTNKESFQNAKTWVEEVRKQEGDHVVIGLAGNKSDLAERRAVPTEDGESFASEGGFVFKETSAKTGMNIQDIFRLIAEKVPPPSKDKRDPNLIDIDKQVQKKK